MLENNPRYIRKVYKTGFTLTEEDLKEMGCCEMCGPHYVVTGYRLQGHECRNAIKPELQEKL